MKPLKIALAITDLDVGGAERNLAELATRLDRERFDPVVHCLQPRPQKPEASCVPALEGAGIPVHFLEVRRLWHALPALRRWTRLLAEQKPVLLQSFLFHANILGRIAARRAEVPWVVSGIRVAERRQRWRLWIDRLTAAKVDRHVCVSQSVARFAAERGRLPPDRLAIIPNGVDVSVYPAPRAADLASLGIGPGRRIVVYVGRLDRQKGLAWLIASSRQWLESLPDCELLLVGEGPERRRLEAMCRANATGQRVRFAGWRHDVPEILAAADLLVLPSRWEGMPNAVLQAMASGLAVVATDVEGVRELLGPQADRQVVDYGDTETLTAKIVALMTDRSAAADLGGRNRRRVEEQFGVEGMVEAYQDLWTSLATR